MSSALQKDGTEQYCYPKGGARLYGGWENWNRVPTLTWFLDSASVLFFALHRKDKTPKSSFKKNEAIHH